MPSKSPKSGPPNNLRNIKITLEYDGTHFFGFQKQKSHPTIQAALEEALEKFFNAPMKISAASGRTDTGVHAAHQVVNFKTSSPRSLKDIQRGLNAFLPKSIAVIKAEEAAPDFHARFSARSKVYEYKLWNSPVRSPLNAAHTAHFSSKLNVSKMREAAKLLAGKHDFRSFCAAGGLRENTVRNLNRFEVSKKGGLIIFRLEADGFLQHMVRNLVGTLLEVGQGKMSLSELEEALRARDRRKAGATAPAKGLSLVSVTY